MADDSGAEHDRPSMRFLKLRSLLSGHSAQSTVIAAIIVMVTVNQLGTGVLFALIPVKLAADGYPASAAGGISTIFSLCFLVGCIVGPRLIRLIGPNHAPLALAGINAALAMLHWLFPGPVTWSIFRGIGGIATASYFVLVESWLAAQSRPETRGLVFGVYMVANRLAFAFGQIVISFVKPASILNLFLLSALAYALAPLLRPRANAVIPTMTSPSLVTYLELPRMVPAAAAASLMHGLVFGTVPALLPKWGVDAGFSIGAIAEMLAAMQIGGIVMQLPISYASDRFERRTVMIVSVFATAVASLLVLQIPMSGRWTWLAMMLVWGGFSSTLYSLAAAHANDLAPPERRVAWVSSIMLLWGTGAAVGPLMASLLMDMKGATMLWVYAAFVSAAIGSYPLWRKVARP